MAPEHHPAASSATTARGLHPTTAQEGSAAGASVPPAGAVPKAPPGRPSPARRALRPPPRPPAGRRGVAAALVSDEVEPLPVLVEFFKALVEPARLRLAGLLVEAPLTVSEAQQRTGLPVRTVQNHLRALAHAGLAVVEGTGAAARYRIDENELRRLASTLLVSPRVQAMGDAGDERAKVLASFFRNGKLQHIPTGDRRRLIVLEEFAKLFEPGRVYTEPEVNEVIKQVYDRDYTTIRRWLVDLVFLNRHEGRYWVGEGRRAES